MSKETKKKPASLPKKAKLSELNPDQPVILNVIQQKQPKKQPEPCEEAIALQTSPVKRVTFYNLLDKDEDIAFDYGSGPGSMKYHLFPGRTYDLPECVIEHLRSRVLVEYGVRKLPSGEEVTEVAKKRPKFLLTAQPLGDLPETDNREAIAASAATAGN